MDNENNISPVNPPVRRKRVMVITDYVKLFTGFGRWGLSLLKELYRTEKYEIISVAMGVGDNSAEFSMYPWKTRGVLPSNPAEFEAIRGDERKMRDASYGNSPYLDKIVAEEKPDIILIAQDSWGSLYVTDRNFFKKGIPTFCYVTFDSLPLLQETIDKAPLLGDRYWAWNQFSVKEFNRLGIKNVKTMYPGVDLSSFYKFSFAKKLELRKRHNIPPEAFGILFVFRNQIRKLVDKLIEGYALFKKQNPEIKNCFLHLHSSFHDSGWNIPALAGQYGVPMHEIYCTYVCRETRKYFVGQFQGENLNNPLISTKNTLCTADIKYGVSNEELGEIYNLNNFYVHCSTSGGCELPCVEAAACALPIATCAYSFGADITENNKGSLCVEHNFSTEIGTQFVKSNPFPSSIAKVIKKVYSMSQAERDKLGNLSREWALENYDCVKNSAKIAKIFDDTPFHTWDFTVTPDVKNPNYPNKEIADNREWLKDLYKGALDMNVKDDDSGLLYWVNSLSKGVSRQDIYRYFINEAAKENQKHTQPTAFDSILDKTGNKRILVLLKESMGDVLLASSLLENIKLAYLSYDLYFATDLINFDILVNNKYIHKVIPWMPEMNEIFAIYNGFDVFIDLSVAAQKTLNYLSNKPSLDLINKQ